MKVIQMDMSKYAGQSFIKIDDVRDGPIEEQIAAFGMGKFDRPVLTFESGDMMSLNQTNVRTLICAYGKDGRAGSVTRSSCLRVKSNSKVSPKKAC